MAERIARTYGEALYSLAVEKNKTDEFFSEVSVPTTVKKYDREISLGITCLVTVYAAKQGYINSDNATIKIQADTGIAGDVDGRHTAFIFVFPSRYLL